MSFRAYVKILARDHGLTLCEVANKVNRSRQTITNWLAKPWTISLTDMATLSRALNLTDKETEILAGAAVQAILNRGVTE